MAENKTSPTDTDPRSFIADLEGEQRGAEASESLDLFELRTGEAPVIWGESNIGFGSYDYEYESGRSGIWMRVGFSPRRHQMTVYIMPGFDRYEELLAALGPHSTGKSCLFSNVSTQSTERCSATSSQLRMRRWDMTELDH